MKTQTQKPAPTQRRPRLLSLILWTLILAALSVSPVPEYLCRWIGKPEHLIPVKGFVSLLVLVFALRVVFHPFRLAADAMAQGSLAPAGRQLLSSAWMLVLSLGSAVLWLVLQTDSAVPIIAKCATFVWQQQWLPMALEALKLPVETLSRALGIASAVFLGLAGLCFASAVLIFFWRGSGVLVRKLRSHPARQEKRASVPLVPTQEAADALARLERHRAATQVLNLNRPAIRICQPASAGPVQEWLLTDWDERGYLTFRRDNQELIFRREGENVFILGSEPLQLTPGLVYEVLVELPMPMRVMTITYIP